MVKIQFSALWSVLFLLQIQPTLASEPFEGKMARLETQTLGPGQIEVTASLKSSVSLIPGYDTDYKEYSTFLHTMNPIDENQRRVTMTAVQIRVAVIQSSLKRAGCKNIRLENLPVVINPYQEGDDLYDGNGETIVKTKILFDPATCRATSIGNLGDPCHGITQYTDVVAVNLEDLEIPNLHPYSFECPLLSSGYLGSPYPIVRCARDKARKMLTAAKINGEPVKILEDKIGFASAYYMDLIDYEGQPKLFYFGTATDFGFFHEKKVDCTNGGLGVN